MDYKNGKWAEKIIELQHKDGSWGYFHTLSNPSRKQPMTTEQALRRLKILGFTLNDEPIVKAFDYMVKCLSGKNKLPDHEEKLHNWKVFTNLMLSTWINIFDPENNLIKNIKNQWKEIIEQSFLNNTFNQELYNKGYYETFGAKVKGGRLISFVNFYQISLLANYLNKNIEKEYFEYILNYPTGIYYVYDKKLMEIPEIFQSKYTSRFIGAIELLSDYNNVECKKQLKYIVKWLEDNKITRNKWDLGKRYKRRNIFSVM